MAKCDHECGLDDLTLCQVRGDRYIVQCKLCGAQWTTKAKYAQALAMDYSDEDLSRMAVARGAAPKNSARAAHKRKATRAATTATIDLRGMEHGGGLVLCVSDVLTKNDRYRRTHHGQCESAMSKAYKAAVARAAHAHGFTEPYKIPAIASGLNKRKASTVYSEKTIRAGLWSLEVLSIWPHERHLEGAAELANGDADAPLSMVRDAMQRAGIIDDDMRIVADRTLAIYRKDERRTIARLTRLDGPALDRHHNAIESLLLAELMTDASKPAAC